MKSNFLRLSYFVIAAAGMLTACNQENVSSDIANSGNVLSISVSQNDFSPVDAESRAVTDLTNRTTTFENGDKLGLYVVSNADGSYHYENVPFTYNGESWASASTIYYYKNSDYIVYYPYDENLQLTVGETGVSGAIKTVFESKADFYTQNTADAYEAVDLMMAEVENPSAANVNFNLAHKFSMIEISVPVRKYITEKEYNGEKFEYNAPVKLEWTSPLAYGENKVTPYAAGKGVYRFIVKPGTDVAVNIDGYVQYEEEPFNFSNNNAALTLTEGSFKHYKVTVDGISNDVTVRDLKVGDYYYSDGSIYPYGDQTGPYDLDNPMVEGCIGVIYQVADHTYTQGDNGGIAVVGVNGTEWIHGNVVALNSVVGTTKWGANTLSDESNNYTSIVDSKINLALITDMRGYELSNDDYFKNQEAVADALGYQVNTPSGSSGWYLPSAGQLTTLFVELGEYNINLENTSFIGDGKSQTEKTNAYNRIKGYLEKVDGTMDSYYDGRWWTVTETGSSGNYQAYTLTFKGSGKNTGLLTRPKNNGSSNYSNVRPVLSF